jgi:TonB family protein
MKTILMTFLILLSAYGYSQKQGSKNANRISPYSEDNLTAGASSELAVAPVYPGGNEAFLKFISKNIQYPVMARQNKVQGKVLVRFQVDADGHIKNAIVPQGMGIGSGCDEEAVRVVMSSSQWKPATRLGTPASMWYEVPIVFALTEIK